MKPARDNIQAIYPLSPIQHGMLFHTLLQPGSGVYIPQTVVALEGHLDETAFAEAWQQSMDRHDLLRTIFVRLDTDKPLQIVLKQVRSPLEIIDWRKRSDREAAFDAWVSDAWRTPFDINRAPLLRLTLIRWSDHHYRLVTTYHHALTDGWSQALVFNDFFRLYQGLITGESPRLKSRPPFKNYIQWLERQDRETSLAYWRNSLTGASPSELGGLLHSAATAHGPVVAAKHEVAWAADAELTQALQAYARKARVTLNTVCQALWAVLLARLNGTNDVLYGATVAGRPTALNAVEEIVGPFINSVPVRLTVRDEEAFDDWLRRVQAAQIERDQHAYLSLGDIKQEAGLAADQLPFNSLLVFENYPSQSADDDRIDGFSAKTIFSVSQNNYPLSAVIFPDDVLHIKYKFDPTRINRQAVDAVSAFFADLLRQLAQDSVTRVGDLYLPGAEAPEPVADEADLDALETVLRRFSTQVAANPGRVAVSAEEGDLSYAELDRRSTKLARYLSALGAGPGELVAVVLPRGADQIEAVLAVLKAGAAYLPLDPHVPGSRLEQVLNDAEPVAIVASVAHLGVIQAVDTDAELVVLERDAEEIAANADDVSLPIPVPDWPAYRIYTSGSTGEPKGVVVTHGNLDAYVQGFLRRVPLPADATLAALSTVAADLGNTAVFGALLSGRTLRLLPARLNLDAAALAEALRRQPVTVLKIVPSHLQALLAAEGQGDWLPPVLILGGEVIPPELLTALRGARDDLTIYNHYGPTEATIGVMCGVLSETALAIGTPRNAPLGPSLAGASARVLDPNMRPVPAGGVGELYLGGPGLAQGYAGQPRSTAERFVPDPFDQNPGARLYRTGDRVRVGLDGVREFAGRVDHQVKLRGHRVELGEIEAALRRAPGVRDAVVMLANERLRAFVAGGEASVLRGWMADQLPDYMQPTDWHCLDALLLTANGKVDRLALKALPVGGTEGADAAVPGNALEETLATIWRELLGREQVGVETNFFDLGGNSLMLIQAHARINQAVAGRIEIVDLFRYPSIRKLGAHIERQGQVSGDDVTATTAPNMDQVVDHATAAPVSDEFVLRRQAQQRQQARARAKRRGLG